MPDLISIVIPVFNEQDSLAQLHAELDQVGRDGQLSLEILDDGRGLAPGDLDKPGSYGLRGLSERARAAGGWLEVSPGRNGTALLLTVPVDDTGAAGADA